MSNITVVRATSSFTVSGHVDTAPENTTSVFVLRNNTKATIWAGIFTFRAQMFSQTNINWIDLAFNNAAKTIHYSHTFDDGRYVTIRSYANISDTKSAGMYFGIDQGKDFSVQAGAFAVFKGASFTDPPIPKALDSDTHNVFPVLRYTNPLYIQIGYQDSNNTTYPAGRYRLLNFGTWKNIQLHRKLKIWKSYGTKQAEYYEVKFTVISAMDSSKIFSTISVYTGAYEYYATTGSAYMASFQITKDADNIIYLSMTTRTSIGGRLEVISDPESIVHQKEIIQARSTLTRNTTDTVLATANCVRPS